MNIGTISLVLYFSLQKSIVVWTAHLRASPSGPSSFRVATLRPSTAFPDRHAVPPPVLLSQHPLHKGMLRNPLAARRILQPQHLPHAMRCAQRYPPNTLKGAGMLSKATPANNPLACPVSRRLRYEAGRIPTGAPAAPEHPRGSTGRSAHCINPTTSLQVKRGGLVAG